MIVVSKITFDIEKELVARPPDKQIAMKSTKVVPVRRVSKLDGGFIFTQCQSDEPGFAELPIHTERKTIGSEFQVIGCCRVPLRPVAEGSQPNTVLFLEIAIRSLPGEHRGNVQEQDSDKEW